MFVYSYLFISFRDGRLSWDILENRTRRFKLSGYRITATVHIWKWLRQISRPKICWTLNKRCWQRLNIKQRVVSSVAICDYAIKQYHELLTIIDEQVNSKSSRNAVRVLRSKLIGSTKKCADPNQEFTAVTEIAGAQLESAMQWQV